jgi:von Willebrand factor type A domain
MVSRMPLRTVWLAAWLGAAPALAGAAEAPPPAPPPGEVAAAQRVAVRIESPAPGTVVEGQLHQAELVGSARADADQPDRYEVLLVLDVSESTQRASGADVDGDGVVGVDPHEELVPAGTYPDNIWSTDPQDTVLHAEIQAARALVHSLDPRRVRVGVISFAGEVDPTTLRRKRLDQQDAWLEVPLTDDYAQVNRALTAVLARGARGATNFAAAIRLVITELASLEGARSHPRPGAKKVALFLTDGMPTLPFGTGNNTDPGDVEAAVRAAEVARKAGIVINTYALGQDALRYPKAATEVARVTLGTYTPVQRPGDIAAILQGVTFASVEDVVVANVTTGELSTDVRLGPDGSFTGYIPVREGNNHVRVTALATDGSEGSVEFDLVFRAGGLTDREKELQLERMRNLSRELLLRREGEHIDRFREQQRKELELQREQGAAPTP